MTILALTIPSWQTILVILVVLAIVGVAWKILEPRVSDGFKAIIYAVAAIGAVLLILQLFGVL